MNFRIYIDTSVIGGYFDKEFEEPTKMFFKSLFESQSTILISDLLELEIMPAPNFVRDFFYSLPNDRIERIQVSQRAKELAILYINEKLWEKRVWETASILRLLL